MPLHLALDLPLNVENAGLLTARGYGQHPERVCASYELIFVREGTLAIQEEAQSFRVEAGEALLLWPGRKHRGTEPYSADLKFYWLHFSPAVTPLAANPAAAANPLALNVPQHTRVCRPDHLTELFRRFLDDQETENMEPVTANCLLLLMLTEAARAERSEKREKAGLVQAGRAERYIRTHFHLPLSAAEVAQAIDCNPNYLAALFRRTYGQTLTEAIHAQRLAHARRLLLDGSGNINQVARACGFESAAYFRRLFRRQEGLSPMQFRRLYARAYVNTD